MLRVKKTSNTKQRNGHSELGIWVGCDFAFSLFSLLLNLIFHSLSLIRLVGLQRNLLEMLKCYIETYAWGVRSWETLCYSLLRGYFRSYSIQPIFKEFIFRLTLASKCVLSRCDSHDSAPMTKIKMNYRSLSMLLQEYTHQLN